jgi:hypothetical protein
MKTTKKLGRKAMHAEAKTVLNFSRSVRGGERQKRNQNRKNS